MVDDGSTNGGATIGGDGSTSDGVVAGYSRNASNSTEPSSAAEATRTAAASALSAHVPSPYNDEHTGLRLPDPARHTRANSHSDPRRGGHCCINGRPIAAGEK